MINTNNNRGNLGYRGKVTIKTKRRGKFYAVHASHNNGLPNLFIGLCNVLSGKANLEQVRPARVAVYSFKSSTLPSINTSWDELKTQLSAASPLMLLNPEVLYDSNTQTAKSVFQSQIPFGYITSEEVYVVALFPINTQNADSLDEALAFYRIASNTGWQAVKIDRSSIDSSFVVEWQMDFQNISEEA
jgi:hypothetical protein